MTACAVGCGEPLLDEDTVDVHGALAHADCADTADEANALLRAERRA